MKFSSITTMQVAAMCIASILLYIITDLFIGDTYSYYFSINPFISGLLHSNIEHLLNNLLIIFLCLNVKINRFYTFEKIFWITSLISILHLPVIIINNEFAAIGISGTCYFLLARSICSVNRFKWLGYVLTSLILYIEFICTFQDDTISHSMHIIGLIFGIISLYTGKIGCIHEKIYEIIS
jgi:membrane associated rhomboid family serine protease